VHCIVASVFLKRMVILKCSAAPSGYRLWR
jgi:hypothetical protein